MRRLTKAGLMEKGKKRIPRRRILLGLCVLFLALCVCTAIDYWGYPYGAPIAGRSFNRGENGLWLRYTWYFGQHSDAERRTLAQQLQKSTNSVRLLPCSFYRQERQVGISLSPTGASINDRTAP